MILFTLVLGKCTLSSHVSKVVLPKLKKKLKKHKENNPDYWTLKLMSLLCKSDFTNTVSLFVVCVYIVFSDVLIFGTCADEIWCLHVVGYTYVTSSVCPCWQQLADSSRLHRPCILFLPVMSWPSSLQRAIQTNETSVRRSALSSQIKWVREKVKEKANAMESKPCCWQKAVFSFNSCTCKSGFNQHYFPCCLVPYWHHWSLISEVLSSLSGHVFIFLPSLLKCFSFSGWWLGSRLMGWAPHQHVAFTSHSLVTLPVPLRSGTRWVIFSISLQLLSSPPLQEHSTGLPQGVKPHWPSLQESCSAALPFLSARSCCLSTERATLAWELLPLSIVGQ